MVILGVPGRWQAFAGLAGALAGGLSVVASPLAFLWIWLGRPLHGAMKYIVPAAAVLALVGTVMFIVIYANPFYTEA